VEIIFFRLKFGEISPQKKTLVPIWIFQIFHQSRTTVFVLAIIYWLRQPMISPELGTQFREHLHQRPYPKFSLVNK
jgi:hypothetical protein